MRQSITTKYLGPTDRRGTRVKATSSAGLSVTVGWDDALSDTDNYAAAAVALCKKLGWSGTLAVGGGVNVYVFVEETIAVARSVSK
jgi:hypothetical protein